MKKDFIPFHKPYITQSEISEVIETINSGWLTTGPKTQKFEREFCSYIGSKFAITASSWTAAAHLALEALGLKPGDEVIVPAITFTSTAEIVCYFGAKPIIVDVQKDTLNIDPIQIAKHINNHTKVVIPVHYGGQPCDMDEIFSICNSKGIRILEDAAHALPAFFKKKRVGTISDVTCFSFYATKTLSTGEGGMICSDNEDLIKRCSVMRLHGISKDAWDRYSEKGNWYYEVIAPGFKYNFTDIQASLGLAQLEKIEFMHNERKKIYNMYNKAFSDNDYFNIFIIKEDRESSHHLYPICLKAARLKINRSQFIEELKNEGIGTSVHFIPLYRHPFYKKSFGLESKDFPVSESLYEGLISLPIWPGMLDIQIEKVIEVVLATAKKYKL